MRKLLFGLSLITAALLLMLLQVPNGSSTVALAQEAQNIGVSLTVYNQGTALVQDRRTIELQQGINLYPFVNVAASIDPTSVSFTSLTDPLGTVVLEQSYVYDLVGSSALLERYLDETVQIVAQDGTEFRGQLLSGRNGEVILREENGQVIVLSLSQVRDLRFPALPDGLITRPTLRWMLESATAGSQNVEVTYQTSGISWTADYNLLVNPENTALNLNGWVTLTNTSGAGYQNAQLKLIAGDVNRLPEQQAVAEMALDMMAVPTASAAPRVAQREFFEYNLYEVERPITVSDNETKQIEFVTGANVPASTFYVYNGTIPFYGYYGPNNDPLYGNTGITDVQNWLEFTTSEEGGLGADLPAGRIRVYQEDIDGSALLIGENQIDHTPQGEDVQIYLGNAFDLVGERIQTDFRIISDTVIEETYQITLRNRKDTDTVEIRVPETLFRWSNWEILSSSHEYTKTDSSSIEYRVQVPPQGETIITYTVRYSW